MALRDDPLMSCFTVLVGGGNEKLSRFHVSTEEQGPDYDQRVWNLARKRFEVVSVYVNQMLWHCTRATGTGHVPAWMRSGNKTPRGPAWFAQTPVDACRHAGIKDHEKVAVGKYRSNRRLKLLNMLWTQTEQTEIDRAVQNMRLNKLSVTYYSEAYKIDLLNGDIARSTHQQYMDKNALLAKYGTDEQYRAVLPAAFSTDYDFAMFMKRTAEIHGLDGWVANVAGADDWCIMLIDPVHNDSVWIEEAVVKDPLTMWTSYVLQDSKLHYCSAAWEGNFNTNPTKYDSFSYEKSVTTHGERVTCPEMRNAALLAMLRKDWRENCRFLGESVSEVRPLSWTFEIIKRNQKQLLIDLDSVLMVGGWYEVHYLLIEKIQDSILRMDDKDLRVIPGWHWSDAADADSDSDIQEDVEKDKEELTEDKICYIDDGAYALVGYGDPIICKLDEWEYDFSRDLDLGGFKKIPSHIIKAVLTNDKNALVQERDPHTPSLCEQSSDSDNCVLDVDAFDCRAKRSCGDTTSEETTIFIGF